MHFQSTLPPKFTAPLEYFFICLRPFDQKLGSSLIYLFYLYTTIWPKIRVLIFYLHTTIRPNYRVFFHLLYSFFSAQPFDQKLGSSLIYFFHLHTTIQQKYMIFFLSFILSLCTTIRPKNRVLINLLFLFVHDHLIKLGFTLSFLRCVNISFAILMTDTAPIFLSLCFRQCCLYISSAIFIVVLPISFVHCIYWRPALIFRTLYPWLYEVPAKIR